MQLKRISSDAAAELTDSILVSIGAEDPNDRTAAVMWMAEGNVISDEGPMIVAEALDLAKTLAEEQGKDIVYVVCEPEGAWKPEWGQLIE